jgi:hypothetical protein
VGRGSRRDIMAVVKVIEVLAQSDESWEDAVQQALDEASKTVRNIKSIYVKDFQAIVEGGEITGYRVNTKISFEVGG